MYLRTKYNGPWTIVLYIFKVAWVFHCTNLKGKLYYNIVGDDILYGQFNWVSPGQVN